MRLRSISEFVYQNELRRSLAIELANEHTADKPRRTRDDDVLFLCCHYSISTSPAIYVSRLFSYFSFQSSTLPQSSPSTRKFPPVTTPNRSAGVPSRAFLNSSSRSGLTVTTTLLWPSPNQ